MSADRPQAVRFFAPDHPALTNTVRGKIAKLLSERAAQLVSSQDWPDFNQRRGVIMGLNEALQICDEVNKEIRDS